MNTTSSSPLPSCDAGDGPSEPIVTATLVEEKDRLATLPRYFGSKLTRAEFLVYHWMSTLCAAYSGGFWLFYRLSNGGFYMAPACDARMHLSVDGNGFSGDMTSDAAGIVACLFAFAQIASEPHAEQEQFIELYHQLRDYALCHHDARLILRAID